MLVSIVVPLYNEAESIRLLHASIVEAVADAGWDFEIIFVDDGSSDKTFDIAKALAAEDRHLTVIRFRRNFGQTPAMAAGIDHARGDILVTMDGDLQNDPRDIPVLVAAVDDGNDLAVGWRHNRQDKLLTRKIPSKIANWLIGKVTGVPIKDNGCSLKAYRRDVIQSVPFYSEMHRFIPAMTSLSGARVAEIKVRHHARKFGESKYGLSRIYKVLMDLLTIKMLVTFGSRPLRWFAVLALLPAVLGATFFVYSIAVAAFSATSTVSIGGSGLLLLSLALFLLMTGALCELIYRSGDIDLNRLAQVAASTRSTREVCSVDGPDQLD